MHATIAALMAEVEVNGRQSALPASAYARWSTQFATAEGLSMDALVALTVVVHRSTEQGFVDLAKQLLGLLQRGLKTLGLTESQLETAVRAGVPSGPSVKKQLDKPRASAGVSMRKKPS